MFLPDFSATSMPLDPRKSDATKTRTKSSCKNGRAAAGVSSNRGLQPFSRAQRRTPDACRFSDSATFLLQGGRWLTLPANVVGWRPHKSHIQRASRVIVDRPRPRSVSDMPAMPTRAGSRCHPCSPLQPPHRESVHSLDRALHWLESQQLCYRFALGEKCNLVNR